MAVCEAAAYLVRRPPMLAGSVPGEAPDKRETKKLRFSCSFGAFHIAIGLWPFMVVV